MKEATGEFFWIMWPNIQNTINDQWGAISNDDDYNIVKD